MVIVQPTIMSFFRSLKFQVTIALTLVLAFIIGGAVWQVIRYQRRALDSLSHDQAELMADAVESWLASLMLQHRGTELQGYVENYVIQKDIVDLKVVRMDGTVAVASDPDETGKQVTGWSPAALAAGAISPMLQETIRGRTGHTVLRLIEKAPECGECHHETGPYRGALALTVSSDPFDACKTQLSHWMVGAGGVAAASSALFLFVLITLRVNRPMDAILRTLRRVGEDGDLDTRIRVRSRDEFGVLAEGFNDMMERVKKAQRELEAHHQREMEQSGHLVAVGEMVGVISHELRNPLAALRSAIQVLVAQADEDDPDREVLAQLDATTQRLDTMLGKTLDLLRPSRMLVEFIDINAALTQALFFIQRDRRRGVTLEMDLAKDPPLVHVDGEQLQQVFLNLALNALQAMGSEGTLTIATRVEQERGAHTMVVTFSDTGPGIPEDQRELIFEPLYTTRTDGTGLGLSTSRRIIERHGGNLTVVSRPGHGASFVIRLPVGMEPQKG